MGKKLKRRQLAIEEMREVATSQAERSDTKQEEIQNKIEGISHSEKVEAEQPTVNDSAPSRGSEVKWEKKRSFGRITKKPDRLGHNIMISNLEASSSLN